MLTNFRVPIFQPKIDVAGLFEWFKDFMGRWSGSDLIKNRLIDIGTWDMDATVSITKSLGRDISFNSIVGVHLMIRDDAGSTRFDASLIKDGIDKIEVNSTDVILTRTTGGFFDTTDFDDTSISRGTILILYTT